MADHKYSCINDVVASEFMSLRDKKRKIISDVRISAPYKTGDRISRISFDYDSNKSCLMLTISRGTEMKPLDRAGKISSYNERVIERFYSELVGELERIRLTEGD
ncbi:hypothetical protein GOV12_00425 [Candidatus Pacearchaeota archaeon]|nr:hypothetical protein [Candidatus Pacearchaeota archaeon]